MLAMIIALIGAFFGYIVFFTTWIFGEKADQKSYKEDGPQKTDKDEKHKSIKVKSSATESSKTATDEASKTNIFHQPPQRLPTEGEGAPKKPVNDDEPTVFERVKVPMRPAVEGLKKNAQNALILDKTSRDHKKNKSAESGSRKKSGNKKKKSDGSSEDNGPPDDDSKPQKKKSSIPKPKKSKDEKALEVDETQKVFK